MNLAKGIVGIGDYSLLYLSLLFSQTWISFPLSLTPRLAWICTTTALEDPCFAKVVALVATHEQCGFPDFQCGILLNDWAHRVSTTRSPNYSMFGHIDPTANCASELLHHSPLDGCWWQRIQVQVFNIDLTYACCRKIAQNTEIEIILSKWFDPDLLWPPSW